MGSMAPLNIFYRVVRVGKILWRSFVSYNRWKELFVFQRGAFPVGMPLAPGAGVG